MKSSFRTLMLDIPFIGYGLRIVSNLLFLPRRMAQVHSQSDKHQAALASLEQDLSSLRQLVDQNINTAATQQETLETLDRGFRLLQGKVSDLQHASASNELAAHGSKDKQIQTSSSSTASSAPLLLADDHSLDRFYIEFENKFRGSEEAIIERQKIYLPYLEHAKNSKQPIIDIGCGRGEFLKLLRQENIPGKGIDLNFDMIQRAKEQGLDAQQSNAVDYLQRLPSASVPVITGFHIVEHIPFAALLKLMDECYRAIAPGGYAIFETPNPENLVVGSLNFYHDPSHLNPIPPALLTFVMETRGFSNIEIKRLHPMETDFNSQDPLTNRMAQQMFGPSDYAVVAKK